MSSYIQIIPSVLLLQLTTPTATYSSLITYSQKVLSVFPNSQTSDIQGPRYSGKGNECHRVRASSVCFSGVPLFAIPGTVAHRAPLSTRFSRQEYWSGFEPASSARKRILSHRATREARMSQHHHTYDPGALQGLADQHCLYLSTPGDVIGFNRWSEEKFRNHTLNPKHTVSQRIARQDRGLQSSGSPRNHTLNPKHIVSQRTARQDRGLQSSGSPSHLGPGWV